MQHNAKVNEPDFKMRTPLLLAYMHGHVRVAHYLWDHGAHPEQSYGLHTLLFREALAVRSLIFCLADCLQNTLHVCQIRSFPPPQHKQDTETSSFLLTGTDSLYIFRGMLSCIATTCVVVAIEPALCLRLLTLLWSSICSSTPER